MAQQSTRHGTNLFFFLCLSRSTTRTVCRVAQRANITRANACILMPQRAVRFQRQSSRNRRERGSLQLCRLTEGPVISCTDNSLWPFICTAAGQTNPGPSGTLSPWAIAILTHWSPGRPTAPWLAYGRRADARLGRRPTGWPRGYPRRAFFATFPHVETNCRIHSDSALSRLQTNGRNRRRAIGRTPRSAADNERFPSSRKNKY